MRYVVCVICLYLSFLPVVVGAVSDEFTFRIIAGDDVTPPTTPTLVSVVPIAPTQIDVDWTAATDNWIFGGYVLLRDGSPIATTSLTSFGDTGLTPEILYEYTVYAFDAAGNISSTSLALATTTLALPPVTPTSTPSVDTGSQSTLVVRLGDFTVTPGRNEATLAWTTNIPSRFMIRWGRTDAYTGGYISNETYQAAHLTTITDLEPGTVYQYEVIGYTPANRPIVLKRGEFSTTKEAVVTPVANVERLMARVVGTDVELTYELPAGEVGAKVRILRSHLGFPGDLFDGAIVYEGTNERVYDTGALSQYIREYYTVFVIREDGSVSSGAVVVAEREGRAGEGSTISPDAPDLPDNFTGTTSPVRPDSETVEIALNNFLIDFITIEQLGSTHTFGDSSLVLSYRDSFTLSIAKESLPKHLKSIVVTLVDPTDQRRSYSFLLRLNQAGTAYEAVIAPLLVVGASELRVDIYDFEQRVVGRYSVPIDFAVITEVVAPVVFPDSLIHSAKLMRPYLLGLGIFLILGFILVWYRSRETEDKP
jgi:chitodextrinase